ncbi:3-oxoacyl-ACP reductase FabG [Paenibacillus tritici]|uniref:SDR family NAD(P)-dependent oxidoreductase n=1 Tax=Paenibacillus tritici TaxID=1873425 RepID=UPI001BA64108|nr:3-oxoacyl-ACP reductase family protein [Paenibacillus tritici]QUL55899.1 3-oxoacyl-ACP reductase FabG [Paenibacillus tritici]
MKQVAVVTGGSRGIGAACALGLAQTGMDIVVNYRENKDRALEVVEAIRSYGAQAVAVQADVSQSSQVKRLFAEAVTAFGRVDVLVNNAGISDSTLGMMITDEQLDRCIDTNLKGCMYSCKQAALLMMRNKRGKIINLSSVSSIKGLTGQSLYSATKAAVNAYTRVLAKELARFNIQVNAVAPGFIETDMVSALSAAKQAEYLELIPARTFGRTEDVANLVCFLGSGKADYITGQVMVVDGGLGIG